MRICSHRRCPRVVILPSLLVFAGARISLNYYSPENRMMQFTEQPKTEMKIQTEDNGRYTIRFKHLVRIMILVGPRLPRLAWGASHKANRARNSVQSHASTFFKVNSTKECVQSRVSTLCNMLYSCFQKYEW